MKAPMAGSSCRLLEAGPFVKGLREVFKRQAAFLASASLRPPGLCVLSVGKHAPSEIYIARKKEMAESLGFSFRHVAFDAHVSMSDLLVCIEKLNQENDVDGMILQLPLPQHLGLARLLTAVTPLKDVDGLHPFNRGLLAGGDIPGAERGAFSKGFIPCTPLGCLLLLKAYGLDVQGKHVVIVGRSCLVGRPLASLFLAFDATVTVSHTQTKDLALHTQSADIVCVAAGQKHLLEKEHFKKNGIVLDIGIHQEGACLTGDVAPSVQEKVGALSPVPGGVGPMTVMGLMHNTLKASFYHQAQEWPYEGKTGLRRLVEDTKGLMAKSFTS